MKLLALPPTAQLTSSYRHYPTPSESLCLEPPPSYGRSSVAALRNSLDTPLGSYAAQRHRYRLHTTSRGTNMVQVIPLS